MPSFRVKFFNTLLSSDGHPFKVLQRVIPVRHSKTGNDAMEMAQRHFEQLEHIPNWRLHADSSEVESESEAKNQTRSCDP